MKNKNHVRMLEEAGEKDTCIPGFSDLSAPTDKLPMVFSRTGKKAKSKQNRRDCTPNQERMLLDECGGLCPLCGEPLVANKNGRRVKLYDVAHIYPHSPTAEQLEVLKGLPAPADAESLDNLILLCKKHHAIQDFHTTPDEYLQLYMRKQQLVAAYRAKQESACIGLEAELKDVLKKLMSLKKSELIDLPFEPLFVKQKIEEGMLRRKVLDYVSMYYETLKLHLRALDNKRSSTSEIIASQFKQAFLKRKTFSLVLDKEQIFNGLVEWVQSKVGGSRSACEAIVSCFVQDCEVFDAIPE